MILVRQNMVPVLPLLALYAFWQHGWKAIWLLITGGVVVIFFHILYWPDIMQLWSWIPRLPRPVNVEYSSGGTPSWNPQVEWTSRLLSVFQAFRFHFAVLTGSILGILLWPRRRSWNSTADFRAGSFLFVLFLGLIVMHSMAAIGQDYCVFCFAPYVAFFNVAGILFLVLVIRSWNWWPSNLTQVSLVVILLLIALGMGFSAFEDIGTAVLNLPAPRVRDLAILPGSVTWREILFNRFQLDINASKKVASASAGLIMGVLITLITFGIWKRKNHLSDMPSYGAFHASIFLILGVAFSPLLHGSAGNRDCGMDVIAANEQNGEYLKTIISAEELVYWDGGLSAAPLLYLPDAVIIPAQINDGYSYIGGGVTEELYKYGLWNEGMNAEWREGADFFIIEEARYPGWMGFFPPDQFDEYGRTPQGTSCLKETRLRTFRRK
jgi:hypothetical protein